MKEWNKLSEEIVFSNNWFDVVKVDWDRGEDKTYSSFIRKAPATSCIVALTEDNKIIIAKQFRPGPEKTLLDLPGGFVDEGESPLDAAKREFLEETGYNGDFEFVASSFADAFATRIRHSFVAKNCKKVKEPIPDDKEKIEVVLMSIDDFRDHLRTGQLCDVETGYLGLDHLNLL